MHNHLPDTHYQPAQRQTREYPRSSPGVSVAQAVCSLAASWRTPTKPVTSGWRTESINLAQPSGLLQIEVITWVVIEIRVKVGDVLTRGKARLTLLNLWLRGIKQVVQSIYLSPTFKIRLAKQQEFQLRETKCPCQMTRVDRRFQLMKRHTRICIETCPEEWICPVIDLMTDRALVNTQCLRAVLPAAIRIRTFAISHKCSHSLWARKTYKRHSKSSKR